MKLLIDINEGLYKATINGLDANEIWDLRMAVASGTPISDNATFGDVIEKITNRKPLEDNKDDDNIIISTKLWNAPYQKGDKE